MQPKAGGGVRLCHTSGSGHNTHVVGALQVMEINSCPLCSIGGACKEKIWSILMENIAFSLKHTYVFAHQNIALKSGVVYLAAFTLSKVEKLQKSKGFEKHKLVNVTTKVERAQALTWKMRGISSASARISSSCDADRTWKSLLSWKSRKQFSLV